MKNTLKIILALSILAMLMLVSGCLSCAASGTTDQTPPYTPPTPTATVTPVVTPTATPSPANTTQNATQPSATVTPTVTPLPVLDNSSPYAKPGWPTYGVYYYLNLNPEPTSVSTGSIYGYVYEPISSYSPSPMPLYDYAHYGVHVECDSGPFTPVNLTLDSNSRYELTGLSHGTYIVSWYYDYYPTDYYGSQVVIIDAGHPNVQQNLYVLYW